jgi:hypothetical protein
MATSMESATVAATSLGVKGPRQFQGLFDIIPFKCTYLNATTGAEDTSTGDVTVTGAALGDFVLVSSTTDLVDIQMTAFVSAANTVTIMAQNTETADTSDSLDTAVEINGIVLKPKQNIFAFHTA